MSESELSELQNTLKITGVKINYYLICRRKLWLFSHGITLEREHENVNIGKILHKTRYGREKKEERIRNNITVDFIRIGNELEIHDIKKSRAIEDSHVLQIKFYLKYLSELGVKAVGIINYPVINQLKRVELTEYDMEHLDKVANEINEIILGPLPEPNRNKICKKCAYEEFCFGDDVE